MPFAEAPGDLVLTAKTQEFRRFADEHAADKDAFSNCYRFTSRQVTDQLAWTERLQSVRREERCWGSLVGGRHVWPEQTTAKALSAGGWGRGSFRVPARRGLGVSWGTRRTDLPRRKTRWAAASRACAVGSCVGPVMTTCRG